MTDRAIERFAIKTPSGEQSVASLSGGNQQKVVLGRWTVGDPKIFVLEDPTRGVDVPSSGDPQAGSSFTLASVTAVVVGTVSIFGRGTAISPASANGRLQTTLLSPRNDQLGRCSVDCAR